MCWEQLLCERRRSIVPRPDQDPDDTRARAKLARLALWARSSRLPRPGQTAGHGEDEPSKAVALERRCPAHHSMFAPGVDAQSTSGRTSASGWSRPIRPFVGLQLGGPPLRCSLPKTAVRVAGDRTRRTDI